MDTPKNDRALRFYHEVLGLDHLHYGIWNFDDALTLENLKIAQQRYEDFVVDSIPHGTRTILDVGCGTGELSKRLKSAGYSVEGLSPDINQKDLYSEKTGLPFHFCCFEDFVPPHQFDCIIMSESGQYIPLEKLFSTATKALTPGGHLISIDYFVRNDATGIMAKSGHNLEQFEKNAATNGFKTIHDEDITERVLKTLDVLLDLVNRIILALEIGTEKFRKKHPYITRIADRLTRKKRLSMINKTELLNSNQFRNAKRYKLYVFQLAPDR